MKKITSIFVSILILFTALLPGCSKSHNYVYEIIEKPSCNQPGSMIGVCTDCGATITVPITPPSHNYAYVTTPSTCKTAGNITGVCGTCGTTTITPLPLSEHNYAYSTTPSSCKIAGNVTGICGVCGDTTVQTLPLADHDYDEIEHVCSVCNKIEYAQYLEENQQLGATIPELASIAQQYMLPVNSTEELLELISKQIVTDIAYKNGFLSLNYSHSFTLLLRSVHCDFTSTYGRTDLIKTLTITRFTDTISTDNGYESAVIYTLNVIYSDGTLESVGKFNTATNGRTIKSLAVNNENELLLVFSDNLVKRVGTLSKTNVDENESLLVYSKNEDNTYSVAYAFNAKNVVIPATHRGLMVTSIKNLAFRKNTSIESIVLGENVTKIGTSAFAYCTNLKEVTLNKNLSMIDVYAFYNCTSLKTVNYKGTVVTKNNINIKGSNTPLTSPIWNYI